MVATFGIESPGCSGDVPSVGHKIVRGLFRDGCAGRDDLKSTRIGRRSCIPNLLTFQ
jgi:hypothetical protein